MIAEIDLEISVAGISHKITAEVEYLYHKKIPGVREGGVVVEPGEPARVEIENVEYYLTNRHLWYIFDDLLSDEQISAIQDEIMEKEHG